MGRHSSLPVDLYYAYADNVYDSKYVFFGRYRCRPRGDMYIVPGATLPSHRRL